MPVEWGDKIRAGTIGGGNFRTVALEVGLGKEGDALPIKTHN